MKTIQLDHEQELTVVDVDRPMSRPGELLVKVRATAVNRTDLINVQWAIDGERDQPILGVEVAGEVVEAPAGSAFKPGDAVMGLVNGGGYSEYVRMPESRALPVPDHLSFIEAAAVPEVFLTAYQTLYWLGELSEEETVLVHAGGSGVGTAAIQLAKQLSNARVIVTAGSDEKLAFTKEIGADITINYRTTDFDEAVLEATDGVGVDVILDLIGASYWEKNLKSIKQGGRWVLIGTLGGNVVKEMNIFDVMAKFITLKGTLLTPRSDEYKRELSHDMYDRVRPYFEDGRIRPVVDRTFALRDVAAAHQYMADNKNIGKIVLTVDESV